MVVVAVWISVPGGSPVGAPRGRTRAPERTPRRRAARCWCALTLPACPGAHPRAVHPPAPWGLLHVACLPEGIRFRPGVRFSVGTHLSHHRGEGYGPTSVGPQIQCLGAVSGLLPLSRTRFAWPQCTPFTAVAAARPGRPSPLWVCSRPLVPCVIGSEIWLSSPRAGLRPRAAGVDPPAHATPLHFRLRTTPAGVHGAGVEVLPVLAFGI